MAKEKAKATGKAHAPAKEKGQKTSGTWHRLNELRPKRRPVFFAGFVIACALVVNFHDTCNVSKKRDCGWSGVSQLTCRTSACFLKAGGEMSKRTIKIPREEGQKLGLKVNNNKEAKWGTVKAIDEGCAQEHNAKLPSNSPDRILVGDHILRIDGTTSINQELSKKTAKTVEVEITRSNLPWSLRWLHGEGKPGTIEKLLSKRTFQQWSTSTTILGGLALTCWTLSGYGAESLPMYFLLSAVVAFYLTRCCYDDAVPPGTPHCYKGSSTSIQAVALSVSTKLAALAQRVATNPGLYFKWLFI
mmetsp:Transcript_64016/g.139200  ORF Transcript_64016/g.139200 Transcript_64016/m.139200 type:complete len:302 (+) Transcript_64016:69-974(+)